MDALRLARVRCCSGDLVGCSHVFGPLSRPNQAAGPDEIRRPTPDQGTALGGARNWAGLVGPRLDRFAITSRSPSQPCRRPPQAGAPAAALRKGRPSARTAQMIRAVLLAIATAATLVGR